MGVLDCFRQSLNPFDDFCLRQPGYQSGTLSLSELIACRIKWSDAPNAHAERPRARNQGLLIVDLEIFQPDHNVQAGRRALNQNIFGKERLDRLDQHCPFALVRPSDTPDMSFLSPAVNEIGNHELFRTWRVTIC